MSKLLLVEDDNNLREIYEARLQAEGYTIVTAKDGEEALVVAKAERPDLIISDIMMPKISGFEMLDILRNTENLKNVPVIMLTALGQNDDQQRADKLGADRYLVKSQVTLEDIVRVTHELLGDDAEAAQTPQAPAAPPAPAAPATPPPPPTPSTPATPAAPEAAQPTPAAPAADPPAAPAAPATDASAPTTTDTTEPVSATDTPEEAPAASTPATDDAAPSTDATASNAAATTTAQEGAAVEARIEDFVSGASQDASPPAASEVPEMPAETNESPAETAEPVPADSAPATDTSAVDPAPTAPATDASAPTTTDTTEPVSATDKPEEAPAASTPATDDAAAATSSDDNANASDTPAPSATPTTPESSPVVHDKVIKPLESDPKKDINTLLALEAVKEANDSTPVAAEPIIVDSSKVPESPAPASDPNATALGANPSPSSVIPPVSVDSGDDDTTATETVAEAPASPEEPKAKITQAASSVTRPAAAEEPGADLNGIAL